MRTIIATALAVSLAGAAHAETCTFTTECFDGEGCSETDFEVIVDHADDGTPTLETVSETLRVTGIGGDGERHSVFTAIGPGAAHMLTRVKAGDARYTVHLTEGPMVISYMGTCKASDE